MFLDVFVVECIKIKWRVMMGLYDFLQKNSYVTIIGNGFDLSHNIPTRYSDFLNQYKGTSAHFVFLKAKNEKLNWIDVEDEISKLHSRLLELHDQLAFLTVPALGKFYIDENKYNEFVRTNINGGELANLYTRTLTKRNYKNSLKMIIDIKDINEFSINLRTDFENFTNEFKKYLISLNIEDLTLKNNKLSRIINSSKHCICYNYTSTLLHFIEKSNITYVHGNLQNGIVLGIPYNKCDMRMKEISKEIKVHEMGFSLTDRDINSIVDRQYSPGINSIINNKHLVVVGHSLGQSDSHNLLRLFNNDFSKIFILYHKKYVKVELMINLFELLGKDEAEKQIASQRIEFVYFDDI